MAKGTIAIEEAIIHPQGVEEVERWTTFLNPPSSDMPPKLTMSAHSARLLDIHEKRLQAMDDEGVEYMLLSLTSPGCQGEADKEKAETMATESNDYLAAECAKNPKRFGAFAALSMHDPIQAAAELKRCVKDLGMFGGMVNDFQSFGSNSEGKSYYDEEKFAPFWEMVQELDVPIYFHPRFPIDSELEKGGGGKYSERRHMLGAGVSFHLDLSFHVYAVCSSGFLDRFPGVKIVVGHLGEGIPFNLWRACHWINHPFKKGSRPCKQDYKYYFTHNVFITTSGFFSTEGLKFCVNELGIDRCLYAIDTPYENVKEGQDWWKSVNLSEEEKDTIARRNSIRVFKLPLEE
ncbi:hypothetical protein BGZ60DRAFT_527340 [Tricladium varicosporioides]|nr:hypothetical protein BGZ60DRAFT_527340 [Hymenoscyphus varicosporioides]